MVELSGASSLFEARRAVRRLSAGIAWFEARFAGAVVLVILGLLLANVISRAFGVPLIWTDELAIYLLAVGAFAGASLGIHNRHHIAVTLVSDMLPESQRRGLALAVDVTLLAIFLCLGWMLWLWFDPVGVLSAESLKAYARESFNFIYQEPTTTLGVRKIWFWLALPMFCIAGTVHVLASFGEAGEAR